MIDSINILPLGDSALIIRLGDHISPELHARVIEVVARLQSEALPGVTDIVPAFASVTVHYNPLRVSAPSPYQHLRECILPLLDNLDGLSFTPGPLIEIPVCYGGEFGPDLADVASYCGLTEQQVVSLHTSTVYLIYMIGFLPGFPYLGGLPEQLVMPRRVTPRLHVPAGSVGIGGAQTGVYPMDSPGGWQVIGRTPVRLFTPEHDRPTLLQPGDQVRFISISSEEYAQVQESI